MQNSSVRLARSSVVVPILAAVIGTFLYHRYSLLTGLDRVEADPGDSRFIAFLLEHWRNALHGSVSWRSPPIFWPQPDTLAYSDLLVAMGVLHAALRSGFSVFAAMNAQLVILSLASFGTTYLLARRGFGLSVLGATASAYFFAFSWPRFAQLAHVQLQFTALLPVLVLLALECIRDGRVLSRLTFGWRACALSAGLVLLFATTFYYAIFFALALSVAIVLCLPFTAIRLHLWSMCRLHWLSLLLAALLAAALALPALLLYWPVLSTSRGRPWAEVVPSLPTPAHMLWMGQENLVWGWLFSRWPDATIVERWPELRIGVGLIASLAWIASVAWALLLVSRFARLSATEAALAIAILTGLVLQFLMLRTPFGSAWWLVWAGFPGANGIRAVPRLEIVVTLAMGLGFGALLDRAWSRAVPIRAVAALLALGVAVEQVGGSKGYSGQVAEALSRSVAAAIPPGCIAALIVGTPEQMARPEPVDEAHFDAAAYLAANPDIAAAWHGTPWEHYDQFGRAEHRSFDPTAARLRVALLYFGYNYTVPLAAALGHVPVVNGLSGWTPPGWDVFDILSPSYPARLAAWLVREGKPSRDVCIVPVSITLKMMPELPPEMWP